MSSISQPRQEKKSAIAGPGSLLAILGGGQLGRMMAMAARTMGYRVRVMDPEQACPASFVADETIVGRWDDVDAARRLAAGADAVTLEIEQIGVDALSAVAEVAPLRPGVEPIRIIQDKTLQKTWLAEHGFPVGPFCVVRTEAELREAVPALGGTVFVKIGRGGYDGRGQARIGPGAARRLGFGEVWRELGLRPCVAEQELDLDCEISVMAARNPSGEVRTYPAARNQHENQILAWSVLPAGVPKALESRAEELAAAIVAKLGIEGLLCVEIFVTTGGELLVNELAPRPHNSYHQ
ncbi:MAG: ATP-grasp domain-containing protein, partial [Terracidiphilus sp.]